MGNFHLLRTLLAISLLATGPLTSSWGQSTPKQNPPAAQDVSSPQFLPYGDGQKWKEYDLSAYTSRLTDVEKPEQAIIDWILRETGTEVWFSEPLGFMSASRETLRVYHVPDVQDRVQEVVARFVDNPSDQYVMGVRLITVSNPNWRANALHLLRAVSVQSPGVDAWLLTKENSAVLLSQLRKRTDFQEHSSPNLVVYNGQSQTLERRAARTYVRSVQLRENNWPSYELETGSIDEGYTLLLSPLMSLDGQAVDAVIKCHVDQVERFVPVQVDVPNGYAQTQRVQVEVPQLVSWRLHERFRWPTDQVLLLSCGVVAAPGSDRGGFLGLPLGLGPARADALLLLDCTGKASQALVTPQPPRTASGDANFSRGRY
jgi:hypothetical protein